MKLQRTRLILISIFFSATLISCQLFASGEDQTTSTPVPEFIPSATITTTDTVDPDTPVASTATELVPTATQLQALPPTEPNGETCVVLQNLNFRTGPGIAYRPPVRALPPDTELIPIGFNPVGVPGGSWIQVRIEEFNEVGWVSAGSQFVDCAPDLTNLPQVNVPLPAPPAPPSVNASAPDGTIHPDWVTEVFIDPNYFIRLFVYDTQDYGNGPGIQDGDGIVEVSFEVIDPNGNPVWERTEVSPAYCIFSGGEPNCNPWVIEDYFYRWGPGGLLVEEGEHQISIIALAEDGDTSNWNYTVTVELLY